MKQVSPNLRSVLRKNKNYKLSTKMFLVLFWHLEQKLQSNVQLFAREVLFEKA